MINITIQQMIYALEIEKVGSISQAANNLYMNQPNLSKVIKDMESILGISVFVRNSKGVVPSAEGKIFLDSARKIIWQMEQMEKNLENARKEKANFRISIPRATYITYAFTEFISEIQDVSEIEINYRETNTADAIENILYQEFDLAIIRTMIPEWSVLQEELRRKELCSKLIWQDQSLLLMSRSHPLAMEEMITCEMLKSFTELIHGDDKYDFLHAPFEETKKIYLYERGSQFDLLRKIPSTYMWVSPLPDEMLNCHQLVQRECIDNKEQFIDVLVYKPEHHFTKFENQFLDILKKIIAKLNQKQELL